MEHIEDSAQPAARRFLSVADVELDGACGVRVKFDDGHAAQYAAVWLRDNAPDGVTNVRTARSSSKVLLARELDINVKARVRSFDEFCARIVFDDRPDVDVEYTAEWLYSRDSNRPLVHRQRAAWLARATQEWTASTIESRLMRADFQRCFDDEVQVAADSRAHLDALIHFMCVMIMR